MSGPIIRTGSNEEFAQGWDRIFGGKKKSAGAASKAAEPKAVAKKKAKTAKTAKAARPAKKAAKKKASK